jgi:hypothetical protein
MDLASLKDDHSYCLCHAANETIKLYSKTKVEVCVPSAQHALGALAALVDCDQISLWHEPFFEVLLPPSLCFIMEQFCFFVGFVVSNLNLFHCIQNTQKSGYAGGSGAVVQWEYYSNFCGGLYAGFSCGMG